MPDKSDGPSLSDLPKGTGKPESGLPSTDPASPAHPSNPTPGVAPVNAPQTSVVYVASPPPHVQPKPNDTPPGGKFGIRDVEYKDDGKKEEKIRWVNAHGCEFTDDEQANQDDKSAREKRDMMKARPK